VGLWRGGRASATFITAPSQFPIPLPLPCCISLTSNLLRMDPLRDVCDIEAEAYCTTQKLGISATIPSRCSLVSLTKPSDLDPSSHPIVRACCEQLSILEYHMELLDPGASRVGDC
jgi:hypothetical protein